MINILKEIEIILTIHGKESFLISLKIVASSIPTLHFFDNGDNITNPYDIANISNNCFASTVQNYEKHKIFT